jgi:hypothetical protein
MSIVQVWDEKFDEACEKNDENFIWVRHHYDYCNRFG